MKKRLLIPLLVGSILAALPSVTSAATLTTSVTQELTDSPWSVTLAVPKFDLTAFPGATLNNVSVQVDAAMQGTFQIKNLSSRPITYGARVSEVGTDIAVQGPIDGSSLSLDLSVVTNSVKGVLPAFSSSPPIPVSATATQETNIDPIFLPLYTYDGTGDSQVFFKVSSEDIRIVSISGSGQVLTQLDTFSSVTITTTYDYTPALLEIPEPSFGVVGIVLCGLAGLALKRFRSDG